MVRWKLGRLLVVAMVVIGASLLPQSVAEASVPAGGSDCVDTSDSGLVDRWATWLRASWAEFGESAVLPGQLLDLTNWKLTLPSGRNGRAEEITGSRLSSFTNGFFRLNDAVDGVVFTANAGGVTTPGSSYPRSELREMDGTEGAAWDSTVGTHTLDVCQAITRVPTVKPEVVSAQIHDSEDDVLQIRLEDTTLSVQYDDGEGEVVLDPDYRLGTPFRVTVVVTADGIAVSYNGEHKADITASGTGWYWKVGAYVQSNTSKGEAPGAVGEVVVYSLDTDVHDDGDDMSVSVVRPGS